MNSIHNPHNPKIYVFEHFKNILQLNTNRKKKETKREDNKDRSNLSAKKVLRNLRKKFDRRYEKIQWGKKKEKETQKEEIKKETWKVPILYTESKKIFFFFCIFELYRIEKSVYVHVFFEDLYSNNKNQQKYFLELSYKPDVLSLDDLNFSYNGDNQDYLARFEQNKNAKLSIGKLGMSIFNHFEFLVKPKISELHDQTYIEYINNIQLPLYKLKLLTDDSYYKTYGFQYNEEFYEYFKTIREQNFYAFLNDHAWLKEKHDTIFNKKEDNVKYDFLFQTENTMSIKEFFVQYVNLSNKYRIHTLQELIRFVHWFYYQVLINYKIEKNPKFYLPKSARYEDNALLMQKTSYGFYF